MKKPMSSNQDFAVLCIIATIGVAACIPGAISDMTTWTLPPRLNSLLFACAITVIILEVVWGLVMSKHIDKRKEVAALEAEHGCAMAFTPRFPRIKRWFEKAKRAIKRRKQPNKPYAWSDLPIDFEEPHLSSDDDNQKVTSG